MVRLIKAKFGKINMTKECPKCKGEMVEQQTETPLNTNSGLGFIGARTLKPFICKKCGYVEFWT